MIYPKYIVNLQHNVCGSVLWMILCLTTYFLLSVNACRLASPEATERYFGPCDQCQQKWTTMVLKLCPFGVSKRAVRLTLFFTLPAFFLFSQNNPIAMYNFQTYSVSQNILFAIGCLQCNNKPRNS